MNANIDLTDNRVFANKKIRNSDIISEVVHLDSVETETFLMLFNDIKFHISRDYEKLPYCIKVINNKIGITNAAIDTNKYCDKCGSILINNNGLCDYCKFEEEANYIERKLFKKIYIPNIPQYFERL